VDGLGLLDQFLAGQALFSLQLRAHLSGFGLGEIAARTGGQNHREGYQYSEQFTGFVDRVLILHPVGSIHDSVMMCFYCQAGCRVFTKTASLSARSLAGVLS
jgi:hypothetical protein